MKFVNRKTELNELEHIYRLSQNKLFPVLITGPRRVGKTELAKQFIKNKKHLYFFIYEGKSLNSLLRDFEQEFKNKGILDKFSKIESAESFVDLLFEKCRGYVILFDEAQYMKQIYKPFFSLMQRKFDEKKDYRCMIIFLGSITGLIKKVFEGLKAPLYGRIKAKINLQQLSYIDIREMMLQLGYKEESEFIEFYAVFGGFPKYYIAIEDYELNNQPLTSVINYLFFRENAPLSNEIIDILIQEFGKRKSYYYDILEAIAAGKTKLNEIAIYCGKTQTGITPFMRDLIDYHELIKREVKATENPEKSRNSIYRIKSPIFNFWFRFVYKNLKYVEIRDFDYLMKIIKKNINSYIGTRFEELCRELAVRIPEIKTKFGIVGKWWGYYRSEEGERNEMELDLCALNKEKKHILFGECKWQKNVDAEKIVEEIAKKSQYVEWNKWRRVEYYAVFAKSFSRKIKSFDGKIVHCIELKDIKKFI